MSEPGDWTTFGRVDADGTVYVRTAAGERVVGSWQAGPPEEGLVHFARRFADLVTEVDLLQTRLGTGAADPRQSMTSIRRLRESLDTAHVVGDLDGLGARLDQLAETARHRADEVKAAREAARTEALARKQALAEEAERIAAESTHWKTAGDRLKEILEEWRTIRGIERKTDTELWKRYAAARDAFTRRRGAHFANLDSVRKQAQSHKETLVEEAESLSASTEWGPAATRMRELMNEWRTAPRASKEAEQRLWQRFRAAQDQFFTRRSEAFSARDAELKGNLELRQQLLAEAEALDVDADPRAAQQQLRGILDRWSSSGRVPREVSGGLERRLRAVEDRVREAAETAWRRTPPESNPLLAQMRDQVARAEKQLEKAVASGDAKRIRDAEQALATKRRFLEFAEHGR